MEFLAGFDALQIAVAAIATLGAAFIRGLTGFGFGILLVPILALAITPVQAVLALNIMAGLLALTEVRYVLREAERSALTIGMLVLLATAPGLALLDATPPDLARLLIALVALSAFVAVLLPRRSANVPGPLTTGLTGLSAGLLTGFAAMPGPPVVPYYVGRDIPRTTAKASMIGIFGIAAMAGVGSGAAIGVLEWRIVILGLALFPLVLLGNWLGSLAFGKVEDRTWRIFVGTVLAAAAVAALVKLA
ncbi:sulfite exporter TauE/SafE family protein [Aurantiacibacter poecillastricola]|uniref:sulfite exporter TauE/SafE family protein n=1 Tax=Aurantiacibacter poecillastricola TaxID=3064385 RepID=UPI00273D852A|nr:sulfite exporter TauE/SafE family protein [Aurantiacibacter sp. 219JJ12-13]MDP5260674.1 sulfite exporter TauE/SafE family protein [Aurantiacibacter sp. 219JJ12-13]